MTDTDETNEIPGILMPEHPLHRILYGIAKVAHPYVTEPGTEMPLEDSPIPVYAIGPRGITIMCVAAYHKKDSNDFTTEDFDAFYGKFGVSDDDLTGPALLTRVYDYLYPTSPDNSNSEETTE